MASPRPDTGQQWTERGQDQPQGPADEHSLEVPANGDRMLMSDDGIRKPSYRGGHIVAPRVPWQWLLCVEASTRQVNLCSNTS